MACWSMIWSSFSVALLAEGVDRNFLEDCLFSQICKSPSSQRAWIEIAGEYINKGNAIVALLAEGVDRNSLFL